MKHEVVLTGQAAEQGKEHLLRHYSNNHLQEDLCFALWRQSTGALRKTAIIYQLITPQRSERSLHGNASFEPHYLSRAIREAKKQGAGVAFLHSHPTQGWQDMSLDDVIAERDVISYPARVTKYPLVGLTIGSDGYWSARWWEKSGKDVKRTWCDKVRVVGRKAYEIHRRPDSYLQNDWSARLRRTEDSWGPMFQGNIESLKVGIVGIGSVGSIAAEAFARIGVGSLTLIDGDHIEEHNLDRLLHGTLEQVGSKKVDVVAEALKLHASNAKFEVYRVGKNIQHTDSYHAALDCDIILSCVDRPIGRDVLNYIAQAHMIPVIDAGVAVEAYKDPRRFFSAHWRAHVVTPEHQCLRCTGQYNSGDVVAELDGSLEDPTYIKGLEESGIRQNMNTFPFALGAASQQVNLALRYLLATSWWPTLSRQEYQFTKGVVTKEDRHCEAGCSFRKIIAAGDASNPPYLYPAEAAPEDDPNVKSVQFSLKGVCMGFWNKLRRVLLGHDSEAMRR